MEYVFIAQNLCKYYGKKCVINNVNIKVKKGEIYGLIGKNGAGKTTLMKMMLGITLPTSGKIFINESENLVEERKKIGSIIETSAFFPQYSARKNLELFATLFNVDYSEIDKVLTLVGLENTGKKPASKFSLGMKQRLGLAIALLGNPKILVLDEPINGLDPEGIKLIRNVILKVNAENKTTIFISSHILDELSKVATTYCLIDKGLIIEEITKQELEAKTSEHINVVCKDMENAKKLIEKNFTSVTAEIKDDHLQITGAETSGQINKFLISNDFEVSLCSKENTNLEQYFIDKLSQNK